MDDLNACFCGLPEELKVLVLSHIEQIEPPHILSLSLNVLEALSLLRALQRTSYFERVAGDDIADCLVRLLDDRRVRSLEKERALELIGVYSDRLCEYACGRNFEVLKWAHNELELPWAPYPPGRVSDDILVLRVLRESSSVLKLRWPADVEAEEWDGVKIVDGRVVHLNTSDLTSVPAEIWQLTSLQELWLSHGELTRVPAEIGQLTSLVRLYLHGNRLTSVPAEIGRLTSLERLHLDNNQLTSVPAEIGQLTSLQELWLGENQLTSLPAEIGQLTSLREFSLHDNQLTSVPAEIGQLLLTALNLYRNRLTSVPAAIRELRAVGCYVQLDDGVTVNE